MLYITKMNGGTITDTAQYAQHQTAEIAHQLGYREMGIYHYNADAERDEILSARLDGIIAGLHFLPGMGQGLTWHWWNG